MFLPFLYPKDKLFGNHKKNFNLHCLKKCQIHFFNILNIVIGVKILVVFLYRNFPGDQDIFTDLDPLDPDLHTLDANTDPAKCSPSSFSVRNCTFHCKQCAGRPAAAAAPLPHQAEH